MAHPVQRSITSIANLKPGGTIEHSPARRNPRRRAADHPANGVGGGPKHESIRYGLLSRAVPDSCPVNVTGRLRSPASSVATSRTDKMLPWQRLSARGGCSARSSARRIRSAASPCQMQLNQPLKDPPAHPRDAQGDVHQHPIAELDRIVQSKDCHPCLPGAGGEFQQALARHGRIGVLTEGRQRVVFGGAPWSTETGG